MWTDFQQQTRKEEISISEMPVCAELGDMDHVPTLPCPRHGTLDVHNIIWLLGKGGSLINHLTVTKNKEVLRYTLNFVEHPFLPSRKIIF